MVSIQIWVTWFHIHCTGELEQVCLALVIGCPFLSTGLGKRHHKQLVTTSDAFVHRLPWQNDTATQPAANVVQVSQDCLSGPKDLLQTGPIEAEGEWELSWEKVTVSKLRHCSMQMKTTSFTLSVFWRPRLQSWMISLRTQFWMGTIPYSCHSVINYIYPTPFLTVPSHEGRLVWSLEVTQLCSMDLNILKKIHLIFKRVIHVQTHDLIKVFNLV